MENGRVKISTYHHSSSRRHGTWSRQSRRQSHRHFLHSIVSVVNLLLLLRHLYGIHWIKTSSRHSWLYVSYRLIEHVRLLRLQSHVRIEVRIWYWYWTLHSCVLLMLLRRLVMSLKNIRMKSISFPEHNSNFPRLFDVKIGGVPLDDQCTGFQF